VIVTCPRCQTKYELADEAIRGKALRGTCKHCGCALSLNDSSPFSSSSPLSSQRSSAGFGTFTPAASVLLGSSANEEDDETRMLPRFTADVSVHEEQTKIGSIPLEALNAEKLFAQRTEPPPAPGDAGAAPAKPKSLNELVDQLNASEEASSTLPKLAAAEEVTADLASVAEASAPSNAVDYAMPSDSASEASAAIVSVSRSEPPELASDSAIESLPLLAADETTEPLETSDELESEGDDVVDEPALAAVSGERALAQDPERLRSRNGWLVVGFVALLVCVLVVWFSGWGARY
jgi:hypothetical protein